MNDKYALLKIKKANLGGYCEKWYEEVYWMTF
jgi:hypothetical protein